MILRQIRDRYLSQYAYLIGCEVTRQAIIVDPQRDVDRYLTAAEEEGLRLVAAVDTHIHADYLSGLRELADRGVTVYGSGEDEEWRYAWPDMDGANFHLLRGGDTIEVGTVRLDVVHTPGHTPEHLSFLVVDRTADADEPMGILTGDFVFVGDVGRPDLLESAAGHAGRMRPDAASLFRSVGRFKNLPPWLQVWPGHGAGSSCGKALGAVPVSTVGYELRHNSAIRGFDRGEEAFVDAILDGLPDPPLYFRRMKESNRSGPPLLESLPQPRELERSELDALAGRQDVAVIDTRPRTEFVRAHVAGSILAPFDTSFCTTVGSYVEPGLPIYLIIDEADVEEAVRCLVRIGLDEVEAFITPKEARSYFESDQAASTATTDFDEIFRRMHDPAVQILDVRSRSEYEQEHLPGALHIPHTRLLDHLDEVPRGKELLVHCATGIRSAVASALLQRHGFVVRYVDDDFRRPPESRAS